MGSGEEYRTHEERINMGHGGRINRRQFISWNSLVAGWAALPRQAAALSWLGDLGTGEAGPGRSGLEPTLLEDGGFNHGARGWQLGTGCEVVTLEKGPSEKGLYVHSQGTSTTRAVILSPEPGMTYTVQGYMRTSDVKPLETGGCAVMSLNQFEFQGRPMGERNFAELTGSHDWTPFSYTFKCAPLVLWFELSLGLYRAEGQAWFANVTLVEGPGPAKISEVLPREEEPGLPTPKRTSPANVAVWRDQIPVMGTASDPDFLGATLQQAGYQVEYLTSDQLADPGQFTREKYDILVLPYGASFPAPAQKTLEKFLHEGGSFFSTGGYAFNNPLLKGKTGWITEEEALNADPGVELIQEGDFEGTLAACKAAGWTIQNPGACSLDSTQAHQGRQSALVSVGEDGWWKEASWEYEITGMHDRERFFFSCWARTEAVSDRYNGYAFINLEQLDASHHPIYVVKTEVVRLRGTNGWKLYQRETVANPETKWIRVTFGLSKSFGKLWVDQVSLRKKFDQIRINTSKGFPNDELRVTPEQIGVFDADYRLRKVASLEAAPDQDVVKTPYRMKLAATGYAASGVLGTDHSRWIPLINAYDGYGRLRGAAGALMRQYNGVYRKSHWAFFGVENHDLFSSTDSASRSLLLEVFDALQRKTFLHPATTNYASYRQGEDVDVFTWVSNFSSLKRTVSANVTIYEEESGALAFQHTHELELDPDATVPVQAKWSPGHFAGRRYSVRIELAEGGKKIDHVETGFLVWDEGVLRGGFPLKYHDNYLRWNDRSIFAQGSDDYIHTFINRFENPKTWYRDISKYKDHFLVVYENLMGTRGFDDVPPEARWRQIDAMVQICQELKLVFFPGLLIFGDTAVENSELKHQEEFCKAFAARYGLSSGLIYYLNGDLRLRNPNLPDLRKIFNGYLKQKYGDEKGLAEAWHVSPPKQPLGSIPPLGGTDKWDDVRTFDNFVFRGYVVRRWLDSMAGAIRGVDTEHPITAEFYQRPYGGIDVVTAIGSLTLGNIGYFDVPGEDVYRFPQTFRFIDMRARDKSINDGEFGVKTHPAWKDAGGYLTTRSEAEENQLYLAIPHYVVGIGGSKVQNWCWKYPADLPFEWGINYPCDLVSRDALLYYRNTGLFFRQFDFRYESPEVFFLIADNHRMGGQGETVREAQLNAIRFLLDLHCNFATIDELYLEHLPASCKVLVYPLPFCPDDDVFDRVLRFVENGGIVYVSGDVSYSPDRKRTRTDRLSKLLGVDFVAENYPNIRFEGHESPIRVTSETAKLREYRGYPCIRVKPLTAQVVAQTPDGQAVIMTNKVGKGRVFYSTDVVELHAPAQTTDLGRMIYAGFLEWAGVERLHLQPDNPRVHIFKSKTSDGEELFTLVNRDDSTPLQQLRFHTAAGEIRVDVARKMTGAVGVSANGEVYSLETSGMVSTNAVNYCDSSSHIMLIGLDQKDLRDSKALCLLPMGKGKVRINSRVLDTSTQFEAGDFQGGRWVRHEQGQLAPKGGWLEFGVNDDRDLSIVLIAPSDAMENAVRLLTNLLHNRQQ